MVHSSAAARRSSAPAAGAESDGTRLTPELLLQRIVDHVRENGLTDASLRRLDAVAGTSHRMLAYHLGSRDEVLEQVLQALRREESVRLNASAPTRRVAMERTWEYYVDERRTLEMRLFFYLAGHAAFDAKRGGAFSEDVVAAWTDKLVTLGIEEGVTPDRARAEARLLVSSSRGLVLDRLLLGDDRAVDEAFRCLLDTVLGPDSDAGE